MLNQREEVICRYINRVVPRLLKANPNHFFDVEGDIIPLLRKGLPSDSPEVIRRMLQLCLGPE